MAVANVPALLALYSYARSDETASHLVLTPFITCGLVLLHRRAIFASVETSWRVGSALLFAGAVLWMLASPYSASLDQKAALIPVAASLVVLWIGAFVLCFGNRASRAALFPLLFLSLMVPLPDVVLNRSIEWLKNGSTEAVAWLFTLTGMPYLREGYLFVLPNRAIEVADACSGIRSTLALFITSLLAGYLLLDTAWKRSVLVLVILPLAILKNAVRIVTLSLLAIHVDPSVPDRPLASRRGHRVLSDRRRIPGTGSAASSQGERSPKSLLQRQRCVTKTQMTQLQPIPFLDLITPHRELEDELVAVFREALATAQFIGGPQVEAFEREFADHCGTKECVGVGSGTDALRFALMAAGVGPGDAVITVAHTFIATVEAISQSGAATEFVDIDERTYNMSPDALAEYLEGCETDAECGRPLGRRTGRPIKALVPVHLYGQMADMDRLTELAERYQLSVVEDACQAHGAEYLSRRAGGVDSSGVWRRAGSMGKAAAFSFYPGKNLGACGEAGAVTTDDPAVARTVRQLRDHGQVRKYYHDLEGYNGRLDAMQAGFLRIKLRHLDQWTQQRRIAAARYTELLGSVAAGALSVVVPFEHESSRSVYHLYVVRTTERDALAEHLKANGIHTGFHYPVPVHLQNCYRSWGYRKGSLPITERVASEIVSLPMFPGLTAEQQHRVAQQVDAFSRQAATP